MENSMQEVKTTELCIPGMVCPMPLLKTKKALKTIEPGELLKVVATDPHSHADILDFCTQTGHEVLSQTIEGENYVTVIKKKA